MVIPHRYEPMRSFRRSVLPGQAPVANMVRVVGRLIRRSVVGGGGCGRWKQCGGRRRRGGRQRRGGKQRGNGRQRRGGGNGAAASSAGVGDGVGTAEPARRHDAGAAEPAPRHDAGAAEPVRRLTGSIGRHCTGRDGMALRREGGQGNWHLLAGPKALQAAAATGRAAGAAAGGAIGRKHSELRSLAEGELTLRASGCSVTISAALSPHLLHSCGFPPETARFVHISAHLWPRLAGRILVCVHVGNGSGSTPQRSQGHGCRRGHSQAQERLEASGQPDPFRPTERCTNDIS